jgi:hypothetical protein
MKTDYLANRIISGILRTDLEGVLRIFPESDFRIRVLDMRLNPLKKANKVVEFHNRNSTGFSPPVKPFSQRTYTYTQGTNKKKNL